MSLQNWIDFERLYIKLSNVIYACRGRINNIVLTLEASIQFTICANDLQMLNVNFELTTFKWNFEFETHGVCNYN